MVRLRLNSDFIHCDEAKEFQFLYGTIKTPTQKWNKLTNLAFQFLYGTIKTPQDSRLQRAEYLFQFLYGTIKTPARAAHIAAGENISIPVWYD